MEKINYTEFLPNEIISLIIEFSTDINCKYVCKKWNNIIEIDKIQLYKCDYTQFLPNEMIDLIIEFSENLNCKYVNKRWNNIVKTNFKIKCTICNTICKKNIIIEECPDCKLFIFAKSYNFLRVMSGMAGLSYNN